MSSPWLSAKTGRDPKGPAPWNPSGRMAKIANDILGVVQMLAEADALPVGPRTIGYRLSMRENASGLRYVKANPTDAAVPGVGTFKDITYATKRLRQCGLLPWSAISDGSAVHHGVGGYDSLDEWVETRLNPDTFFRDLRHGQPVVVEIYVESAELTPLIARVASEYGVRTYSGRGSAGPALAREAASRIWSRFTAEDETKASGLAQTRTMILGIGDLDLAGVQNVMRPHVENVGAFLLAKLRKHDDELAKAVAGRILDFRRIAVTPEQAIAANVALGVGIGSLADYRDSGDNDWSRDVRLLASSPKTETEALDPAALRDLIREALKEVLDMEQLRAVVDEEEQARGMIPALVEKLNGEGS